MNLVLIRLVGNGVLSELVCMYIEPTDEPGFNQISGQWGVIRSTLYVYRAYR